MSITAQDVAALRKKTGAGIMDCKKALLESGGDFEQAIDLLRKKGQKMSVDRAARQVRGGAVFTSESLGHKEVFLVVLNCETDFVAKNIQFLQLGELILAAAVLHKPASIVDLMALSVGNGTVQEAILAAIGTIGEKITIAAYETLQGDTAVSYVHTGNNLGVLVALKGAQGEAVVAMGREIAMQIAAMSPVAVDKDQVDPAIVEREIAIIQEQVMREGYSSYKAEKITEGRLNKFFQENTLLQQPFVKNNKLTVAQYLQTLVPELTVAAFKRVCSGA